MRLIGPVGGGKECTVHRSLDDIYSAGPGYLCIQIGRENPGRIRVVDGAACIV